MALVPGSAERPALGRRADCRRVLGGGRAGSPRFQVERNLGTPTARRVWRGWRWSRPTTVRTGAIQNRHSARSTSGVVPRSLSPRTPCPSDTGALHMHTTTSWRHDESAAFRAVGSSIAESHQGSFGRGLGHRGLQCGAVKQRGSRPGSRTLERQEPLPARLASMRVQADDRHEEFDAAAVRATHVAAAACRTPRPTACCVMVPVRLGGERAVHRLLLPPQHRAATRRYGNIRGTSHDARAVRRRGRPRGAARVARPSRVRSSRGFVRCSPPHRRAGSSDTLRAGAPAASPHPVAALRGLRLLGGAAIPAWAGPRSSAQPGRPSLGTRRAPLACSASRASTRTPISRPARLCAYPTIAATILSCSTRPSAMPTRA